MDFAEAVQAIKSRLSLVDLARRYLNLRQNGSRFLAPCPFHQETKPSFYIFSDSDTFYCFGCQASGDLIEFYSRINGLDFRESLIQLAEEAGIDLDNLQHSDARNKTCRTEKQAMLAMHADAAGLFSRQLSEPEGKECRAYIKARGLSLEIQEKFGIGWASRDWDSLKQLFLRRGFNPEQACTAGLLSRSQRGNFFDRFRGRLMFPIKNLSNQVIAFGGRIIADEDEAKYINSADTPIYSKKDHLYGLAQARRGIAAKGHALLTEGYMDVLALHQFGYDNSVAALGTALTEEQVSRLSGFTGKIGLLFDGDDPGRKAALRAASLFLSRGIACKVILLPDGEDIDSLLRGAGPVAFDALQKAAPDGLTFCGDVLINMPPKDALAWVREFIANMKAPELTSRYASYFAQKLGLEESVFRNGLTTPKTNPRGAEEIHDLCERDTQILVFLARYPERIEDLRNIGADMALASTRGRQLWKLVETHGPQEVIYYLDERQRKFWQAQSGPQAAPRVNCEDELACLKHWLDNFFARRRIASLQAALSGKPGDFSADLDFLHAIRDTMRKNDEQS